VSASAHDQRLVAVLGRGIVPADTPILRADDLGALRGDGIFETMHIRPDGPWLIEAHLDRMERSAALLDIDLPNRGELLDLAKTILAEWNPAVEGALRLICTRGPEGAGTPTVYATAAPIAPTVAAARRTGIRVATISLGFGAGARPAAPWLLGGAKTLSYAVNMASQRWALAHGVDDVLWVSADGFALEGPTSTLVWVTGERLWTVPVEETGILAGTTARWLLDHASDLGWTAGERMITPAELADADGVWFLSSVRGPAEIRSIDGVDRAPSPYTSAIVDLLGFPV
jgi:4-amino-4-deoxychorismate lyase